MHSLEKSKNHIDTTKPYLGTPFNIIQNNIKKIVAGTIVGVAILASNQDDKPKKPTKPEDFTEIITKMPESKKRKIFYAPTPSRDIKNYTGKYMEGQFGKRFWPTKIQGQLINPWLQEHAKKSKLIKSRTKSDFKHLPTLEQNPKNFAYRFYKVGASDSGIKFGEQNDPDYIKIHPSGHEVIKQLQKEFAKILHTEAKLDTKYTPTLTITSIGRDDEYVKKAKMGNASPNSAHKYGIAFDLRLSIKINSKTLEITDLGGSQILTNTNNGEIIELTGSDKIIYELALRQALDTLRTEGKIFINIEGNPPHYHIHVIPKPNTHWIPSDKYFINYPTYYSHILIHQK